MWWTRVLHVEKMSPMLARDQFCRMEVIARCLSLVMGFGDGAVVLLVVPFRGMVGAGEWLLAGSVLRGRTRLPSKSVRAGCQYVHCGQRRQNCWQVAEVVDWRELYLATYKRQTDRAKWHMQQLFFTYYAKKNALCLSRSTQTC